MDFLKTARTRVCCGHATLYLQPEPQAVGDPLLLPVLILPRDDRGEALRPVEFKVKLGTERHGTRRAREVCGLYARERPPIQEHGSPN